MKYHKVISWTCFISEKTSFYCTQKLQLVRCMVRISYAWHLLSSSVSTSVCTFSWCTGRQFPSSLSTGLLATILLLQGWRPKKRLFGLSRLKCKTNAPMAADLEGKASYRSNHMAKFWICKPGRTRENLCRHFSLDFRCLHHIRWVPLESCMSWASKPQKKGPKSKNERFLRFPITWQIKCLRELGRMRRGHQSCTTADLGELFIFSLTGHALVNAAISRGGAESSMLSFNLEKKAVASRNPWIDCFARSKDRRQTFGTRTQKVHGFHCFYANLSWAKVLNTVASQGNHFMRSREVRKPYLI